MQNNSFNSTHNIISNTLPNHIATSGATLKSKSNGLNYTFNGNFDDAKRLRQLKLQAIKVYLQIS